GDAGLASDEAVAGHLERRGLVPMEPELALWVLGQAVSEGRSLLTVTNTDWELFAPSFTAERSSALLSEIPQVQRALAAAEGEAAAGEGESGLKARLAGLSEAERGRELLELVRTHAAAALGHADAANIGVDKSFRDQGFDSLTAVELRNRLVSATGTHLPSGVVFDHPTPRAVADHLTDRLASAVSTANGEAATASSVLGALQRFESSLWSVSEGHPEYKAVQERLDEIVARMRKGAPSTSGPSEADIESASVDQLLDIIDDELLDLP
ncbi:acyl carrier protein, partial [Streptomyces winkii]|uniref:acyl carrier protein n=1 Tax=Streptomyces winkii TaxID=3051178 RepID=UPI0028D848AE